MDEIFEQKKDLLYLLTSLLTEKWMNPYTKDSIILSTSNLLDHSEKLNNDKSPWKWELSLDEIEFPEIKESLDEEIYDRYLIKLSFFASEHRAAIYDLTADSFLYSLHLYADQIYSSELELFRKNKIVWETIKKEVVLPVNTKFKNKGIYYTGLKRSDINAIEIHKNIQTYYSSRKITLQAMIKNITTKLIQITGQQLINNSTLFDPEDRYDQQRSVLESCITSLSRLDLILNIYDHYEIFDEVRSLSEPLNGFKDKGLTIYKHKSIKPGCFVILEKGAFSLKNLSSIFLPDNSLTYYKFDFYEDITAPKVSFGIGYYGFGKNVCLPMNCTHGTDAGKFSSFTYIEWLFCRFKKKLTKDTVEWIISFAIAWFSN